MKRSDIDQSFIEEALPTFLAEAREQILALEQLLLELEDKPGDRGLLDALFRCAHTVKGSAGMFGLDRVVAFTHHVETLLDRLREGALALTPEISTLLLQCNDRIAALVTAAGAEDDEPAEVAAASEALVRRLQELAPDAATARPGEREETAAPTGLRRWHVSVRFGTETYRNGMDPLAILSYVRQLGAIPTLACDAEAVPPLEAIDPESCHLGFEFSLQTAAARGDIEAAFSFVRDDCALRLFEPSASPKEIASLIEAMPDNPRIGDILLAVGVITPAQLQQALREQRSTALSQGSAPPIGEILKLNHSVSPEVVDAALKKQQKQRTPAAAPAGGTEDTRFVRIQADRLDAVINLLGELVIASAGAGLLARATRQETLIEANQQVAALVEEIRNGTLQMRMVPIGDTFSRFRRVVRDTAAELGKEVALEIVGGDTELDKSVVECIADPLMHLVRNALDHGLEGPDDRVACGKPAQGRLTLSARHEGGSILIRIADDGRGIDCTKVLERAWERGLVEPGVVPAEAEIFGLIFQPGFSTAEKVTSLSGRGVGMDVVRRNIEALRGTVSVHSTAGAGSSMDIRLPLTLAIIDGFLVGVGSARFIFPLDAVVEVIEDRAVTAALDRRGRSWLDLRGKVVPLVALRTLYGLESTAGERGSVVIVQAGAKRFGVQVDHLLGQHQTVIKPLGRMLQSLRGVSGSSILGNGEVALILDVGPLAELAAAEPAGHPARDAGRRSAPFSTDTADDPPRGDLVESTDAHTLQGSVT